MSDQVLWFLDKLNVHINESVFAAVLEAVSSTRKTRARHAVVTRDTRNTCLCVCVCLAYYFHKTEVAGQTHVIPLIWGRAMAQAASRRRLSSENRVHDRVSQCGIFGWQSGTGTGLSPSSSVFFHQYYSTGGPYSSWNT